MYRKDALHGSGKVQGSLLPVGLFWNLNIPVRLFCFLVNSKEPSFDLFQHDGVIVHHATVTTHSTGVFGTNKYFPS